MGSWKRQLHLWHRWLGIASGLLVLLWFGSGIVMMYVPYPALTEAERMTWLATLEPGKLRFTAWEAWQATGRPGVPETVRLNTVAGRPAYHFGSGQGLVSVWADDGTVLRGSPNLALAAARRVAPDAPPDGVATIDLDQWTFGRLAAHRPLYRVDAGDAAGSVLYVSSVTGELVRDTTRRERAWNWVGAVVHWLYFTPLRARPEPWRQAVMWTSAAALLLSLLGMVLGLQRLRLRRRYAKGARSPYRGWQAWHHWLGLAMGSLTLTWLFSGWLSVTPFGWLDSPGITARDRLAFAGGPLAPADLALPAAQRIRTEVLELEWRRVDGTLYLGALERRRRVLLDAGSGVPVAAIPTPKLLRALRATRPGALVRDAVLLPEGDDFYYSHHQQAAMPVLRTRFALPDGTAFYADPRQGQLVAHADDSSRWRRWLFNGLHQFDFTPLVRARPAWDVLVVTLCLLGAMLAITGVVLGWRRLRRHAGAGRVTGATRAPPR